MKTVSIYDPGQNDSLGQYRGGGRIMQILHENFPNAQFTNNLTQVDPDATLFIPSWNPFVPPLLEKRIAKKQILMIFDVIPLKYPTNFPAGIRGNLNLWRNKRALKNFDTILTISEHSKRDIVRCLTVSAEKIEVVYPAVSKAFLNLKDEKALPTGRQEKLKENNSQISNFKFQIPERFALYVGDINWNKNLVNLAHAVKIANVPCVFVGKPFDRRTWNVEHIVGKVPDLSHPWMREFKEFLEISRSDKRFIFAGYVKDEELINFYTHAVCNVLVSKDEGFGYSYAEAVTQNCPSVLADIDIFRETAADTALFTDPHSPNSIAHTILQLFEDASLRESLSKKAKKRNDLFSPHIFKERLEKLLL